MPIEHRGKWVRNPIEVRADENGIRVTGYAAVFNEEADIGGFFREVIAPGAFRDALGRDEVVFVYNHDDDTVMARTSAGNLDLTEDTRGLRIEARLSDDDPDAQRLAAKMRAGNINKMSFAFWPEIEEWDDTGDVPVRTIKTAKLHDVSAVTTPAYDGTEIGMRSLTKFREETLRDAQAKANTANRHVRRLKAKAQASPEFARQMRAARPAKTQEGGESVS